MQKATEFLVLHITNGTIFLHCKIITVVAGRVVIIFGELIVSWVPRSRRAFSSLFLWKFRLLYSFNWWNSSRSPRCMDSSLTLVQRKSTSLILSGFLSDGELSNALTVCVCMPSFSSDLGQLNSWQAGFVALSLENLEGEFVSRVQDNTMLSVWSKKLTTASFFLLIPGL